MRGVEGEGEREGEQEREREEGRDCRKEGGLHPQHPTEWRPTQKGKKSKKTEERIQKK